MVGACARSWRSQAFPKVRSFSGLMIAEVPSPSCGRPLELATLVSAIKKVHSTVSNLIAQKNRLLRGVVFTCNTIGWVMFLLGLVILLVAFLFKTVICSKSSSLNYWWYSNFELHLSMVVNWLNE